MKYPVILSNRADNQLESNYQWLIKHYSESFAADWYNGFLDSLAALKHNPERWPFATENPLVTYELREIHFGTGKKPTHRAVFTIRPDMVYVVAIRHVSQAPLEADDL